MAKKMENKIGQCSITFFYNPVDIEVVECNHSLVDGMIARYHYSRKITSNRWKSFAVYYRGVLKGGMQIGYGIKPQEKEHIIEGANSTNVKEFDRMWLSDDMPKFSESKVISKLIKLLRMNYPEVKVLISYADGIRGKVGTIYQATGFVYVGYVNGEFYYIPSKDEWVHPVTMWHWHGTRKIEVLKKIYPDIKHVKGPQYRYVFFLNRRWKKRLKVPVLKSPKKHAI